MHIVAAVLGLARMYVACPARLYPIRSAVRTHGRLTGQSSMYEYVRRVLTRLLLSIVGYFIYDFIDMWRNNLLGKLWELTTHHIVVSSIIVILVKKSEI